MHKLFLRPLHSPSHNGLVVNHSVYHQQIGGFLSLDVALNDDVKQGQVLGTQYNAFGDPLFVYKAPRSGKVCDVLTISGMRPQFMALELVQDSWAAAREIVSLAHRVPGSST